VKSNHKTEMRIALGADHAGHHMKEAVKKYLAGVGRSVVETETGSDEVAQKVASGACQLGLLFCGMRMAANKVARAWPTCLHSARESWTTRRLLHCE
jgi:ribose 5-phosphate isomerase RpiB